MAIGTSVRNVMVLVHLRKCLRVHTTAIRKYMGQGTLGTELTVALLEVLARSGLGGSIKLVGERTRVACLARTLLEELARDVSEVCGGVSTSSRCGICACQAQVLLGRQALTLGWRRFRHI